MGYNTTQYNDNITLSHQYLSRGAAHMLPPPPSPRLKSYSTESKVKTALKWFLPKWGSTVLPIINTKFIQSKLI